MFLYNLMVIFTWFLPNIKLDFTHNHIKRLRDHRQRVRKAICLFQFTRDFSMIQAVRATIYRFKSVQRRSPIVLGLQSQRRQKKCIGTPDSMRSPRDVVFIHQRSRLTLGTPIILCRGKPT